jgi:hypothetical protein
MAKKNQANPRNTIPWAARKLGLPEGQFRRAVKLGQVKTTNFAGLQRVNDGEIARIAELLGLQIAEPDEKDCAAVEVKPAPPAPPEKARTKAKSKPLAKSAKLEEHA